MVFRRERLIREFQLPKSFRITTYLERVFADNKLDIVSISPFSWLPLIPAMALANAVDLSHDVANSEAANAAASSGYFFSTPWVFFPTLFVQVTCLVWGSFNFWKMAQIKSMLVPSLIASSPEGAEVAGTTAGTPGNESRSIRLLPPAVESPELRAKFQSTPFWVRPIESLFRREPPKNRVEELFGEIGGSGPEFYLNSIKFQIWFTVSAFVVFCSQIIPRDLYALWHDPTLASVGDPEHLVPELIAYGSFAALALLQLATMVPVTFLNYCLVTCVEDMVDKGRASACYGICEDEEDNGVVAT